MEYPKDFPKHLQPPVDGAIAEAEITFSRAKQSTSYHSSQVERLIKEYIEHVFFAFASQVCRTGEEGVWTGERIRATIEQFRRDLTIHVYYGKHPSTGDSDAFERLAGEVKRSMETSHKWTEIQERLRTIAEWSPAALQNDPTPVQNAPASMDNRKRQVPSADEKTEKQQPGPVRLPATITSHHAARRMETYISGSGLGQTEFAIKAGTTDRTLRRFRKTGKIRRDIFDQIARAMDTTRQDLLKLETPSPESERKVSGK